MALFHLGFELIKIAILSAVYSSVIYLILRLVRKISSVLWLNKVLYKRTFICIYVCLLIFSFTYYGNYNLGDEANIPLGHFQTIEASDGYASFAPSGSSKQISVDSFAVADSRLCMDSKGVYFVYNLATDDLKKFSNRKLYEQYAIDNKLPGVDQFEKFWPQYDSYWNGWRFWMLP